jgi:opacity protein-like surface antigen
MRLKTVLLVMLCFAPERAFSQLNIPRFEAGLTFSCFTGCADDGNTGFGGRGTVNATKYIAGEFQITKLEKPNDFVEPMIYGNGQAKATLRLEDKLKFNLFGFGGPGFARFDKFAGKLPGPITKERRTGPTLTLGGGLEIVPVRFISVRFDLAYLRIKNQCDSAFCDRLEPTNNSDFKIALMFRFP